jgi:hypothetical protein
MYVFSGAASSQTEPVKDSDIWSTMAAAARISVPASRARGGEVTQTYVTGSTGQQPPDNHLGTSLTIWEGSAPTSRMPEINKALTGPVRPARWMMITDEDGTRTTIRLVLFVRWLRGSARHSATHAKAVHKLIQERLGPFDAWFDPDPLYQEFVNRQS